MSRLAQIQADLQEVSGAVARAERTLAAHPDVSSVAATLKTITKRQESLQEEFLAEAASMGLDACSYRIEFATGTSPSIAGIASSLGSFQNVFTTVYDAVVNGAKKTAKAGAEVIATTTLSFGYSFQGSVGIMMTLPSDKLLVGKTDLEKAMGTTLQLLNATSTQEIEAMTEIVGLPAVRKAYTWASENSKAGFGADIKWVRDNGPSLYLQPAEISNLAYQISSATAREQVLVEGILMKVGMADNTFELDVNGITLRGSFDKAIATDRPAKVPGRYRAQLEVATRIASAEGKDETTFFLVRLDAPSTSGPLELGL